MIVARSIGKMNPEILGNTGKNLVSGDEAGRWCRMKLGNGKTTTESPVEFSSITR